MAGIEAGQDGAPEQRPAAARSTPVVPKVAGPENASGVKRKADGSLEKLDTKIQRQAQPLSKPADTKYTGTAAPKGSSSGKTAPSSVATKQDFSAPKPKKIAEPPTTTKTAPAPPPVAPVKGSYQDLMNRAKARQETKLAQDRRIVNKPIEVRKKEDRKKMLAQARSKSKSAPTSRSGSREPLSKLGKKAVAGVSAVREKPKPQPTEYKGTARPTSVPSYKGTANLQSSKSAAQKSSSKGRADSSRYDQYDRNRGRSYDDDEEEDFESEEGYESSDMEAGILDLDEEEENALRQARREDAAAMKEEAELKRQKLLRKGGMVGRR
jgi:SPT2 chromatin protein